MNPNAETHFVTEVAKSKRCHYPIPPCLFGEGAVLLSRGSQTASDVQSVFACVRVLSPVDVYDLGLQSMLKAPSLPSFPNRCIAALVKSRGASFGMKKILKACRTENARGWLPGARRICRVT